MKYLIVLVITLMFGIQFTFAQKAGKVHSTSHENKLKTVSHTSDDPHVHTRSSKEKMKAEVKKHRFFGHHSTGKKVHLSNKEKMKTEVVKP